MRSTLLALVLTLSPIILPTQSSSARCADGASVVGSGAVSLGGEQKRRFEFEATLGEGDAVNGYITLSGPEGVPGEDVDGAGEQDAEAPPSGLELTVALDSMVVKGNRAVLSGVVASTNLARYAGARVILTVEDNGEGDKGAAPDRLTWGVYRDAPERPVDDAENGDAGTRMTGGARFDANSFPLSSYSLDKIDEGNISVRP
jgi:hypothetical protein